MAHTALQDNSWPAEVVDPASGTNNRLTGQTCDKQGGVGGTAGTARPTLFVQCATERGGVLYTAGQFHFQFSVQLVAGSARCGVMQGVERAAVTTPQPAS